MRARLVGVLARFWLITQLATTIAFVLGAPASAGSNVLVATVQERQEDKDDEADPTRLWELYPLNPSRSGGVNASPSPQPSTTTSPEAPGSVGRDSGSSVPRVQDDRTAEQTQTGLPPLVWGVVLIALMVLLIMGSRLIPVFPSSAQRRRSAPAIEAEARPSPGSPEPPDRGPELVRVELVDGRAVEGWRKAAGEGDGSVLVLDVSAAFDESGATRASSVTDSFIPWSTIREVRQVDEASREPT
jgi:hypothetical protein